MTAQRLGIPSCPRPASRFPQPAVAAYRCGSSASAPEEADAVNSLQPLVSADLEQPQNRQGTSVFLLLPRQMATFFCNSICCVFNRVQLVHRGMSNFCATPKTKIDEVSVGTLISRAS